MKKQDLLKIPTCVLRVNIHCEGCMHKVKKKLKKVEGVYKVSIDSEQGKVTVWGNVDPASLIDKLDKAGKHAQLWRGPQKPAPVFVSDDQLNKFLQAKNGKKGNHELLQQHKSNGNGGFKEGKLLSAKDHKSVSFHLPREEVFDEDDDEFDDDEEYDDDDDEFDDDLGDAHKPPAKASKAVQNAHHKGEKEAKGKKGRGGGGGGGGGIDVFLKGMLKKAGRKKGDSDKKGEKNMKEDFAKIGGKKGGFEFGDLKKGKNEGRGMKLGGEGFEFDGGKQQQQQLFNQMKTSHKGGGGGRNMEMMGQKGGFPAMNDGRFTAGQGNNPYSQQQLQYMMMMMMNQQSEKGHHPSAYARPQPPPSMSYGPPAGMVYGPAPPMSYGAPSEHYSHMFSDENTGSCSIM